MFDSSSTKCPPANWSEDFNRFVVLGLIVKPGGYFAIVQTLNAKLIEPGTLRR